ncbi:MAG: FecR domain-containing protein [Pseudomonadota bacterium]
MRDNPDDGDLSEEFLNWLEASEENLIAWGRIERMSAYARDEQTSLDLAKAANVAGKPALDGAALKASPHPGKTRRWTVWIPVLLVAISLYAFLPYLYLLSIADNLTGTAENQQIILDDGSTLYLGADSAVAVDFTQEKRAIKLLAGVAYFDVQKDASRPFIVSSKDFAVRVVGTRFEVRETTKAVMVSVSEGRVEFNDFPSEASTEDSSGASASLSVGETARADLDTKEISKTLLANPDSVAGWRNGRLVVEGWTLEETLDVLSDYYQGSLIVMPGVSDTDLINGIYDLEDPMSAIRLVAATHDLTLRELSPWLAIVHSK